MSERVDLFVIGAGSGGVRAARIASSYGARVMIAEEYRVGGTCVIRGCVPKKLLVFGAEYRAAMESARGFGWTMDNPRFDWPTLRDKVAAEVTRLNGAYIKTLEGAGVEIINGRAVIEDATHVRVGDKVIEAKHILVATGGAPSLPDVPGIERAITSNEVFALPKLPKTMVIVGGGYIACEFAAVFAGFGVAVTQVFRADKILRGFDEDLRDHGTAGLTRRGVTLAAGVNVTAIGADNVTLDDGSVLAAETVLYATGRAPKVQGLGLESAGVELARNGAIKVDRFSGTNVPTIWAVGDVTDRINLTPVAIREGQAFADTVFGGREVAVDHADIPSAVFTQPPIASVGLTEAAAAARGRTRVYTSEFRPMRETIAGGADRSFMKMLVDDATDRVLGVQMSGADAPEIIQGLAIAVKAGLTKAQLDATVAIHPSAAEEFVLMRTPARVVS